ncbi:MAG TPA: AAA domain-containing protein [Syntrophales bacterium]|nr:AAA domain-containing protein [Syntrophales bacterium]
MPSTIINEFIIALDQEITAIKKGKGGSIVKVFNGCFLRRVSGLFIYVFNLENFLAVLDDSPAEIDIRGKRYSAQVLLTQGLEVEIGIEQFCGQHIAEAKLQTNMWYLLELLKNKFTELNDGTAPAISEILLSGKTAAIPGFENLVPCGNCGTVNRMTNYISSRSPICGRCKHEIRPQCSVSVRPPNEAQKRAITASFFSQTAVIWGPPGTGKTKAIAQAIEAHLHAGRRVLLVSHANAAVDEALEDVAEQLKATSFYTDGKLVRLGIPQSSHSKRLENYPLVLLDKIANHLGESLSKEKRELEEQKTEFDAKLAQYETLIYAIYAVRTLSSELSAFSSELSQLSDKLSATTRELSELETRQRKNRERLIEAQSSGSIKRFFKGLDPRKIQREIDQTSVTVDSRKRLLKEITERLVILEELMVTKDAEVKKAKVLADRLLSAAGVSEAEIESSKKEIEAKILAILSRIAEINHELDEITKKILSEARLIATTLTKTFTAKQFPDAPFDVLILDEASMAPLPHLYWAASKCRGYVTIVGDFLQLPPICIAQEAMAQKWLGRSIFSVLGIDQVKKAVRDDRVTLLDTQYRMAPDISVIPNKFFYQGMLKDAPATNNGSPDDGIATQSLVLVETAGMNPWCSRLSTGGRFNLYNALLCCTIAKKIISNIHDGRVGIIAPYAAQARLINKIAKDWGILDRIRTSTVHRFQGGEEPIIIFDTVEGSGTKVAPMLDDTKPDSDARLLLNVAITRAKDRFYLVAHTKHLLSDLHGDSVLSGIIHHFYGNAQQIPSGSLVDSYFTSDFERWATAFLSTGGHYNPDLGQMYTEKNFWAQFFQDVIRSQQRLIILSPFLSVRRSSNFMDYFRVMKERGIDIRVYTRPRNQQTGEMANQADIVIDQLRSIGVMVIERRSMHQKVAIIDDTIAWEGSLNILSHKDTAEHMRRFEGQSTIEEIIRNLELDEDMPSGKQTGEPCPEPGCGGYLVVRSKYGRKFLGCSNYAKKKCRYTKSL